MSKSIPLPYYEALSLSNNRLVNCDNFMGTKSLECHITITTVKRFSKRSTLVTLIHSLLCCSRTAKDRFTDEEKKALDRSNEDIYKEARLAAESHRQVNCQRGYVPVKYDCF